MPFNYRKVLNSTVNVGVFFFFLCLIRTTISQLYGCHDITFHSLSFQENQLDHTLEEIVSVGKFSFYPSRFFSWSNN